MRPLTAYPKHPELDALVEAFAAGNYRRVRAQAPQLAAREDLDADVRESARELCARTEADPLAKTFLLLTGALLAVLTLYWIATSGGGVQHPSPPPPPPPAASVEIIH